MLRLICIFILIGVLSSLWFVPFNLLRDWWIIGAFEPDLYAQTWPHLLAEWLIRIAGYSMAFWFFYRLGRQEPLFMSMITVGVTLICWPVILLMIIQVGCNIHLIQVVDRANAGFAGYGFSYIFEFALVDVAQVTGWKLMDLSLSERPV